jgi:hypothetical protein
MKFPRINKIETALYEGKEIPEGASIDTVEELHMRLSGRLIRKLITPYTWLAVAYVAVVAGDWGGRRRMKARRKLFGMINKCETFLKWEPIKMRDGWENQNLIFGFGACQKISRFTGDSLEQVVLRSFVTNPPKGLTL